MGRRSIWAVAALAAVVLVASACSGGGGDAAGSKPSTTPEPDVSSVPATPAPSPPDEVPDAFQFAAPALDGGQVDGAAYASTGVALWFWAPW